jgi:CheY-like chemotaxis protein
MPRLKVLIAEDYEPTRSITIEVIKGVLSDSTIIEAGTGNEALDALVRAQPSFGIIDFQMPGMRGDEVIRQYRKQFPDARTAFLLLSCFYANQQYANSVRVPFMQKPYDINLLRKKVLELAEALQKTE